VRSLRPPAARPARLLVVTIAVLLALTGCGVFGADPAASVNGSDISGDELHRELEAIRDNEQYRQGLEAGFGSSLTGESEGAFDSFFAARVLTLRVYYELAEQYLEEEGVTIGEDELGDVREGVIRQLGGPEVFETFPTEYRDLLVHRQAVVTAVDERIGREFRSPRAADEFYAENSEEFEQRCISHILVATEDEASELRERIESGAEFGAVARESSTDEGTAERGGDLDCQGRGTFVPEFEDTAFDIEVGVVSEPIQTPFGFHLILVRETRVPALDEVRGQVEQRLAQLAQDAFSAWLVDRTSNAEVDVSPRYGEWVVGARPGSAVGEVVPPEGPTTTTTAGDPSGAVEGTDRG
jgi:foldase protein PrsA